MTQVTASNEFRFLNNSAMLSLVLGIFFLMQCAEEILIERADAATFMIIIFNGMTLLFLVILCVMLYKIVSMDKKVTNEHKWFGNYEDEFLNYTNLKGYKYAFNTTIAFLAIGMLAGGVWTEEAAQLELWLYCKIVAAMSFISYALPIIKDLHSESE